MKLLSDVRFIDTKLQIAYKALQTGTSDQQQLHQWLERAFGDIERDAFCATQLPKHLIPRQYRRRGIENLWKYNLPAGWRLLYSIENRELIVVSVVIEWLTHKHYERRFKY